MEWENNSVIKFSIHYCKSVFVVWYYQLFNGHDHKMYLVVSGIYFRALPHIHSNQIDV